MGSFSMRRILIIAVLAGLIPPFVLSQTTGPVAHANTARSRATEKNGQNNWPAKSWAKAKSPEELGWSSEKLRQARQLAGTFDTAAVVIVDDGIVVDEWGEIDKKFNVHSIRKSFLSALYGLAVKEAKINLNSTMAELGIDDNEPALTTEEKQARVIDLLKARSGIYHPALYETAGMKAAKPKRSSHPPDSFWYYNNWDFNALGTIFEKAMKSMIANEFRKRLAEPLQMEDFKVEDVEYVRGPDSIHPAYPFRMTARDMARFGLLFLRNGEWRGRQVIPKEWVSESTRSYSTVGRGNGYGYMWWIRLPDAELKRGSFSAQGAGGHYILVFPDHKLVIVHRVNTDIPGKQVSPEQFEALVKLVLAARR
jgi:CubicO group peptidase (beta-lactamase class C family)